MWSKSRDSFKVLHIVENKAVNEAALKLFFSDFQKCQNPADKLSENYSASGFQIESHEMFDALYTEAGDFVACAGIFTRAPWPAGMFRLLNRTYFAPKFRNPHSFAYYASDYLLPGQIERCKAQLDFTFVSRQGPNGGNFLSKLQSRPFFSGRYRISEDYVQVAAGLDDKSFQKILYFKKNPGFSLTLKTVASLDLLPEGIKETSF